MGGWLSGSRRTMPTGGAGAPALRWVYARVCVCARAHVCVCVRERESVYFQFLTQCMGQATCAYQFTQDLRPLFTLCFTLHGGPWKLRSQVLCMSAVVAPPCLSMSPASLPNHTPPRPQPGARELKTFNRPRWCAKFNGTWCDICPSTIKKGELIMWTRDTGLMRDLFCSACVVEYCF